MTQTIIGHRTDLNTNGYAAHTFCAPCGATILANAYALTLQADGKVVVAGSTTSTDPNSNNMFAMRFLHEKDGQGHILDSGFNSGSEKVINWGCYTSASANAVSVRSDGKIYLAGSFSYTCGSCCGPSCGTSFAVSRLTDSGALDSTFDADGMLSTTFTGASIEGINATAITPDGKFLAAGQAMSSSCCGTSDGSYFRNRDCSPFLQRWLSTDPLGYVDGMNVYTYERSSPVRSLDPSGLAAAPTQPSTQPIDLSNLPMYDEKDWGMDSRGDGVFDGKDELSKIKGETKATWNVDFKIYNDKQRANCAIVKFTKKTHLQVDYWYYTEGYIIDVKTRQVLLVPKEHERSHVSAWRGAWEGVLQKSEGYVDMVVTKEKAKLIKNMLDKAAMGMFYLARSENAMVDTEYDPDKRKEAQHFSDIATEFRNEAAVLKAQIDKMPNPPR